MGICASSDEREQQEREAKWKNDEELREAAEVYVLPENGETLDVHEKALVKCRQEMKTMAINVVDDFGTESTIKTLSFVPVGVTLRKELKAYTIKEVHLGQTAQDQERSWEQQGIEEDATVMALGVMYFEREGCGTSAAHVYEGERNAEGKKHGHGKATFPYLPWPNHRPQQSAQSKPPPYEPGVVYEGEFQEDQICGTGKFTAMDPEAEKEWPALEGEWLDRNFGGIYEGERNADGKRDGKGKMRNLAGWGEHKGLVYDGSWKDGKWDGYGKLAEEWNPSVTFAGMFKDGKKHGTGTTTLRGGMVYTVEYVDGVADEKTAHSYQKPKWAMR